MFSWSLTVIIIKTWRPEQEAATAAQPDRSRKPRQPPSQTGAGSRNSRPARPEQEGASRQPDWSRKAPAAQPDRRRKSSPAPSASLQEAHQPLKPIKVGVATSTVAADPGVLLRNLVPKLT
ncbi:uncharacterized protein LOC143387291 [Callospermophilus lateralis]|uniref:uncharacterized protein LOC143387291 n=1 Tax=Callospermophilus lateralis TaxID=76772 RepID=UPI004038756C